MENSQSEFIQLIFNKKYRVLWHVLFWFAMYTDFFFSFVGLTAPYEQPGLSFIGFLIDVVVVYFNLYVLIPKLLLKNKLFQYGLATIICVIVILLFNEFVLREPWDPAYIEEEGLKTWDFIIFYIIDFFDNTSMLILAVGAKLFKHFYVENQRLKEIDVERLKTELGFLKNQVNPHFLFNTMNSFYIQAKKNDHKLPEAILSLSDLLRYQIYDTTKDYVPLESEMEYIRNYLDLENNRRDNLDIKIKSTGVLKHVKIAPLLLLPLVENAVKYSQRTDGQRAIINISVEVDDEISFAISNTKGKVDQIKSPDSGIGLENLKKRLQLIYPDDYSFGFKDVDKIYTASLILGKR